MKAYLHYCDGRVVAVDVRQDAYPSFLQRTRRPPVPVDFDTYMMGESFGPLPWEVRTFNIDVSASYAAGVGLYYEEGYAPQVPRNH